MYRSLHLSHLLCLFHCTTHSLLFHVLIITCCITYSSLITCTISPLITNTLPTHQHSTTPSNTLITLRHPHSHQADLTQSFFTLELPPSNCLIPLPNNRLANFRINFTPHHNHHISTSRSPVPINCTYASHQSLPPKPITQTNPT